MRKECVLWTFGDLTLRVVLTNEARMWPKKTSSHWIRTEEFISCDPGRDFVTVAADDQIVAIGVESGNGARKGAKETGSTAWPWNVTERHPTTSLR
jgi:hypothetical protein